MPKCTVQAVQAKQNAASGARSVQGLIIVSGQSREEGKNVEEEEELLGLPSPLEETTS